MNNHLIYRIKSNWLLCIYIETLIVCINISIIFLDPNWQRTSYGRRFFILHPRGGDRGTTTRPQCLVFPGVPISGGSPVRGCPAGSQCWGCGAGNLRIGGLRVKGTITILRVQKKNWNITNYPKILCWFLFYKGSINNSNLEIYVEARYINTVVANGDSCGYK